MLDLNVIKARAAARLQGALHVATLANVANAANDDLPANDSISQLATLAAPAKPDPGPYTLAQALPDVAYADTMDEAATARFQARAAHCRRLGFTAHEAAGLAAQLHERDLHADYRHLCVECQHYRRGRCGNHAAAGLATNIVGRELATMFQHCGGHKEISHGIT